jgi:hypothetical protein
MDLFGESDLADAQGFDLMEEMRKRGGANLANTPQAQAQELAARQRQIQERALAQQNARRTTPFATGNSMMNHGASGAYHAAMGSAQQGKALGDMISQTMSAHQDENDSRVAQMREMRRMEHEKELKRMELDAILARLAQAQQPTGPQPRASFRGGAIY